MLTYFNRLGITYNKLKTGNFDVCICSGKFALWQGGVFQYGFPGVQFVAIAHGSEINLKTPLTKKITSWSLKQFDKIVSISEFTENLLPPQPKQQLRTIIPNGIDVNELNNANGNEGENNVKLRGKPALLTVGNVTPRKGQQRVIKALPYVLKYLPDAHYHMIGLPTYRAKFEQLANELNVQNHVTFHNSLEREQLLKAYQGCDLFVMLSENQPNGDVEGFGIAILEANFFGKPAIGARYCGIADAINEEQNGGLVDGDQPEEVAKTIFHIFKQKENYSPKAIEWAKKHSWEKLGEHYKAVIEN
jgi:phosphatidylinositol alpha-1,6-mannosyltransferase